MQLPGVPADCSKPRWLDKEVDVAQTNFFMIRVWHVADRCVECGECERLSAGLPLMQLNRKLIKDINELFGPMAGMDLEQRPPLTEYDTGDRRVYVGNGARVVLR